MNQSSEEAHQEAHQEVYFNDRLTARYLENAIIYLQTLS